MDKEVTEALFQMSPTKSLGLDGLSGLFYQPHWSFLNPLKDFLVRKECSGSDLKDQCARIAQ
jgi:hypothetical protein